MFESTPMALEFLEFLLIFAVFLELFSSTLFAAVSADNDNDDIENCYNTTAAAAW